MMTALHCAICQTIHEALRTLIDITLTYGVVRVVKECKQT